MDTIDLEIWAPKKDDPRYLEFVRQRTGKEVFEELKQYLERRGMLPDEYFLLDGHWDGKQLIPRQADMFCAADYGESEGIYVDVFLKYYEKGKSITKTFATGKTLDDTGAALDRMFLTAAAITKAFHGDHGQYARYVMTGSGKESRSDLLLNLTPKEQQVFIDALLALARREQQMDALDGTEQLLRRMTGSITGYMDLVGARPLRIGEQDKASLAIRDGELAAFQELYARTREHAGQYLVEAAGRTGAVGQRMTEAILAGAAQISPADYRKACERAVTTGDADRVKYLMEQAEQHMEDFTPAFYGQVMLHTYREDSWMADELVHWSSREMVAAAPPELLLYAQSYGHGCYATEELITKGIDSGPVAAQLLGAVLRSGDSFMAEFYTKRGLKVSPEDYLALDACVRNKGLEAGKELLNRGMDFDGYLKWLEPRGGAPKENEVFDELSEYWNTLQQQRGSQEEEQETSEEETPEEELQMGGMSL